MRLRRLNYLNQNKLLTSGEHGVLCPLHFWLMSHPIWGRQEVRGNPMASKEQVEKLHAICQDCMDTPIDDLVSTPYGELNFDAARPDLERAFGMLGDLLVLSVDVIPDALVEQIIEHAAPLQETISRIKSFGPKSTNHAGDINSIVSDLKVHVDQLYAICHRHIPYLVHLQGGYQKHLEEIQSALAGVRNRRKEVEEEAKKAKVGIREASGSTGVSRFDVVFSAEAEKLSKTAMWWLVATGLFALCTLLAAWGFYGIKPVDTHGLVRMITTKLFVLGILLSATVWSGKNYRALRHQVTVNQHRANSISTFQAFTEAASDDATRDAVLTETTRAIFTQVPTGYLAKESTGEGGGQLRIVEVARQATKAVNRNPSDAS